MLDFEYAVALAKILCDSSQTDKVRELRLNGVRRLKGTVDQYIRRGFLQEVIEKVWNHKLNFVLEATTKTELEAILKPSAPRYSCGAFYPSSPYHSEHEEMLLWAIVSPNNMLNSDAQNRYITLFNKLLPEKARTVFPS